MTYSVIERRQPYVEKHKLAVKSGFTPDEVKFQVWKWLKTFIDLDFTWEAKINCYLKNLTHGKELKFSNGKVTASVSEVGYVLTYFEKTSSAELLLVDQACFEHYLSKNRL